MTGEIRPSTAAPTATVLVVEDAVAVRMQLAAYLRECGYRVIEAATGEEALKVLQEAAIAVDVVLCDIRLKGRISGFSFINWVRENSPAAKVVTVGTPRGAAEAASSLCETGPQLAAPYEPKVLENQIRLLLAAADETP